MESSSFGESIFYERMSKLHLELKNYEDEQHRLEDEFGRIENTNPSFQSSSGLLISSVDTLVNRNYAKEAEERRYLRNQAILAKIQELETNASVFAARSERLRMMRSEYESLVRKWTSQRKWSSSTSQWQGNKPSTSPAGDFVASVDVNGRSNAKGCELVTIGVNVGVNTDITGPVKAISPYDNDREEVIEKVIDKADSYVLGAVQGHHQLNQNVSTERNFGEIGKTSFIAPMKVKEMNESLLKSRIHPLLDISSTSESQSDFPARNAATMNRLVDITVPDDTSETTSMSIVPRKGKERQELLQSLTDNSISDSTENFHHTNRNRNNVRLDPFVGSEIRPVAPSNGNGLQGVSTNNSGKNGEIFFAAATSSGSERKKWGREPKGGSSSEDDSPTTSVGDSMMDSARNKVRENSPEHEMHIGGSRTTRDDKRRNSQNISNTLINEDDYEEQETQDDLSSSKLALDKMTMDSDAKYQKSTSGNVIPPDTDNIKTVGNVNVQQVENKDAAELPTISGGVSLSAILSQKERTSETEKADEIVEETKHEVKENEAIDDSASAAASNKKEMEVVKGTTTTNATSVTSSSRPKTASRRVKLNLDYEDTESDVSDVAPILPRTLRLNEKSQILKDTISKQSTKQKHDDEFDDFFDI